MGFLCQIFPFNLWKVLDLLLLKVNYTITHTHAHSEAKIKRFWSTAIYLHKKKLSYQVQERSGRCLWKESVKVISLMVYLKGVESIHWYLPLYRWKYLLLDTQEMYVTWKQNYKNKVNPQSPLVLLNTLISSSNMSHNLPLVFVSKPCATQWNRQLSHLVRWVTPVYRTIIILLEVFSTCLDHKP